MSDQRARMRKNRSKSRICRDHRGHKYGSIKEMAEAYGLHPSTLSARLNVQGWDLKRALTEPVMKGAKQIRCRDHKGKVYPSLKAMGEAYGIPYSTQLFRRSSGWKLKRILTTPAHSDKNVDHTGKRYPTMKAMAEAYGITYSLLYNRLKHGWDLEKALTVPRGGRLYGNQGGYRDHLGNTYPTKTAMANAYGIPANVFGAREAQHWDLERALTTPVGGNPEAQKKYTDHKGNSFPSLKAMADAYGIPDPTFRQRLRSGYSMKEALTTPVNRNHKRKKK